MEDKTYRFNIYRSADSEPTIKILKEDELEDYHIDSLAADFLDKYDNLPKKVKERIKKSMRKKYGR